MLTYRIRLLHTSDLPMLRSWWERSGEVGPTDSMLPRESTFVLEDEEGPLLATSVLLLNTRAIAWCEAFIGNPDRKGAERRRAARAGLDFCERFARFMGRESLFCMATRPELERYYEFLGFQETATVKCFVKGVATLCHQ